MFTMAAAFNHMERRLIGERTRVALQHMKSQGKRVGSIPHGFKLVDGLLVMDKVEQKMLRLVNRLHKKGYSLRKISRELARRGILNRNSQPYAAKSIRAMLVPN